MAAKPKTLDDLFEDTLKDIYYAENKILKALPKMAKAAQSRELKAAFEKHLKETEGQVVRLEKVFKTIDMAPKGKKCEAIEGIIEEGSEIIKEFKGTPALDAGLVSSAQAVEHYEIARYGTLKRWAEQLGLNDAVKLLDQTLTEEKNTDESLTDLAEFDDQRARGSRGIASLITDANPAPRVTATSGFYIFRIQEAPFDELNEWYICEGQLSAKKCNSHCRGDVY